MMEEPVNVTLVDFCRAKKMKVKDRIMKSDLQAGAGRKLRKVILKKMNGAHVINRKEVNVLLSEKNPMEKKQNVHGIEKSRISFMVSLNQKVFHRRVRTMVLCA